MTLPNFCIFLIISPLKRTSPFIWTIWNSLYPRMICIKFDWNWLAGSGEDFCFRYTSEYVFPIVAPPDPRGPWCVHFWIYIVSESFHVNMSYSDSVVLEKKILLRMKLACWFWRRFKHKWIWFSLLWSLPTPVDHDVYNSESTLYQRAFM
jgi:hypothetical protein